MKKDGTLRQHLTQTEWASYCEQLVYFIVVGYRSIVRESAPDFDQYRPWKFCTPNYYMIWADNLAVQGKTGECDISVLEIEKPLSHSLSEILNIPVAVVEPVCVESRKNRAPFRIFNIVTKLRFEAEISKYPLLLSRRANKRSKKLTKEQFELGCSQLLVFAQKGYKML